MKVGVQWLTYPILSMIEEEKKKEEESRMRVEIGIYLKVGLPDSYHGNNIYTYHFP